jgi:hypothetical protein
VKRVLVKTCTLTAGYFPDRFAAEGRAPDVFFISESIPLSLVQEWEGPEELLWAEVIREQAELIGEAVVDKYKRRQGRPVGGSVLERAAWRAASATQNP